MNTLFRQGRLDYVKKVLHIISDLENLGQAVCINTVVHKGNINTLTEIANQISSFSNISVWQLFQFMPSGPIGYANRKRFYIDNNVYESAIHDLKAYVRANNIRLNIEAKNIISRQKKYLLVDSSGNVWCPNTDEKGWNPESKINREKVIFGNIDDKKSFINILDKVNKHFGQNEI